jgi:metal iron transporter
MPRWLELIVYAIAEACIIGADISQVVGSATAWTMLIPNLPLAAACVLPLADTLIILLFYSPTGTLRSIRYFEMFIATLVMAIFVCMAAIVGQVHPAAGPVFKGYLPSRDIFVGEGLYTTCAMIGGMLMPHVLYVGTSLARPRLLEYDQKYQLTTYKPGEAPIDVFYRPSLRAIKSTIRYASWEMFLCIFVVGIFINSALEIVAGAALNGTNFDDLGDLYGLFVENLNVSSAKLLGVALLFSGVCAGVVSTMAGQTVMEGAFQIRINPFVRRLVTRCIAIVPAFIVAVSTGPTNFDSVLTHLNYLLGVGLIIIIFPIIWYVTQDKYMSVPNDDGTEMVSLRINKVNIGFAWFIWLLVAVTSIATIVLVAMGLADD